jgi:hypothetical protein
MPYCSNGFSGISHVLSVMIPIMANINISGKVLGRVDMPGDSKTASWYIGAIPGDETLICLSGVLRMVALEIVGYCFGLCLVNGAVRMLRRGINRI